MFWSHSILVLFHFSLNILILGTIFILRKDIGVVGPENGNFPLLYIMEMSLCSRWVVLKSLKTPLRNIKMVPNPISKE